MSMGLALDSAGYASVDALLALPTFQRLRPTPNLQQLQHVAATCPKQRFAMRNDGGQWFMRANQGHNASLAPRLDAEALLHPLRLDDALAPLPSLCVHGTTLAGWQAIASSGGLHPMGRHHVHFSAREFGAADMVSGMRNSSQVLIYVDIERCLRWAAAPHVRARNLTLEFFRSANDVLLTPGVQGLGKLLPSFLFERVEEVLHGQKQGGGGAAAKPRREMPGWSRPTEEQWMAQFDNGQPRNLPRPAAAAAAPAGDSVNAEFAARAVAAAASASSSSAASPADPAAASSSWGPPATSRPPAGWKVPPHLAHIADEVAAEAATAAAKSAAGAQPASRSGGPSALQAALKRNEAQPARVQS
jgi:2'-phosphotransferase